MRFTVIVEMFHGQKVYFWFPATGTFPTVSCHYFQFEFVFIPLSPYTMVRFVVRFIIIVTRLGSSFPSFRRFRNFSISFPPLFIGFFNHNGGSVFKPISKIFFISRHVVYLPTLIPI